MNKIKSIRRGAAKARKVHDSASLDLLQFAGIKRRHAFLRSCRKNMDKKKLNNMVITRSLRHEIRDAILYEQMMGDPTLKKQYKKHGGDLD